MSHSPGQDYEYNTSLKVIGAALRMQKSHLQKVQKLGNIEGRLVEKPRIRNTICNLFHIGHDAYSEIVGGYLHNRSIYQSGKEGGEGQAIPWQRGLRFPGQRRCRSRCKILFEAGE
jgi:hypothetical protein